MANCPHAYCLPYGGCQFDSDVHTDEHGNVVDTCGHCTLLPSIRGNVRATQVGCPVHGGRAVAAAADVAVAESRRLRTQAERDADGTTWRAPEPRCTLRPGEIGTCMCTYRAGCPVLDDLETSDEPHRYTRRNP